MLSNARDRITIQVRSQSKSVAGIAVTWADLETVWGSITPLSANARANLGALQGQATHQIVLREPSTVPGFGTHRVVKDGVLYDFLEPPLDRRTDVTAVARVIT